MPRPAPRHDRDAGGPADVLAAKAALRQQVWSAMRAARVARFPGAAGRIPNFSGAEAAAERLRARPEWQAAGTLKANPDSAQLPVRQRALADGKIVYMAVPRLAGPDPFFALDPARLSEPPRKAASISGAARSAQRVSLDQLSPVDVVVMGSVAEQVVPWYEKYTGIAFPFPKLDMVAIPEFEAGGMENAGAIFYRDSALLLTRE